MRASNSSVGAAAPRVLELELLVFKVKCTVYNINDYTNHYDHEGHT